jgi:hypothetical protein
MKTPEPRVQIRQRARKNELTVLCLESPWFRVGILPEVGAKIYDLIWKPTGRNILWHNPRVAPQRFPIDSEFDNYWCGGWDDGFPTCDECVFRGQRYPGLGELRSLQWEVVSARRGRGEAVAQLAAYGPISPVKALKTVSVDLRSPVVSMRYEITNLGCLDVDFLWGTHPAVAVSEHTVLRIPAKHGIAAQCNNPQFDRPGQKYDWPIFETDSRRTEMDKVPNATAGLCFGHYAVDLEAGWYAVEDASTGEGFLAAFPLEQCPALWLWLNYGGWRGHYHVIVEPWTSVPVVLSEAYEKKTSLCLGPGEVFDVEIRTTVYQKPETYREAIARLL